VILFYHTFRVQEISLLRITDILFIYLVQFVPRLVRLWRNLICPYI